MPLLDQDIRKLPEPVKRRPRRARSSTAGSASQSSPPHTSASNTSYDGLLSPLTSRNGETSATSTQDLVDPPPLQAFRKKRRTPYANYPPPLSSANEEPEAQRYWNEYDHPEDEDTGGYYIFVDPDAPVKFPGQDIIKAWTKSTKKLFGLRNKSEDMSYTSAAEDGSSDDEDTLNDSPLNRSTNYGTLPLQNAGSSHEGYFSSLFRSLRDPNRDAEALQERRSLLSQLEIRQHNAEMTKLRFYSTCLVMSVAIDFILGLMTMTSRKKERGAVDVGVLFGTICTLVLCVVALVSMKTRKEKLGWIHQGTILSIAGAVVALDVLLLFWVVRL
jgi:hypothetical protein